MRNSRLAAALAALMLFASLASGCSQTPGQPQAAGGMLVDFVNVGQGDCTILKIPSFGEDDFFAVVDAGPSQASATVVSELKSLGCDQVDVLVLSHPDADHTGGATDVMNSFKTVEAWDPGTSKDTATWRSTLETMAQKGVVRHNPAAGYVGMWGDAVVRVLGPQPGAATTAGDEVNNACLVLLVSRGENDALLTGDAEVAEQAQVMGETLPPVEVYKVPHHGGRSAYYQPFLAKVAPELSVIGVGPNSYGHPSPEVVSALSVYGKVYRTDSDGDVEVQMSDKRLYIQTGSGKSEVLELKPAGGR